ncbi:restriction endonuclease subunit S [Peribacillus frigoritolerans]|uniref:restriction endonuclease subunit S n=1 Tax=Peribacillus frigoritolerans TaxID=450367 RepID=UPI003518E1E5
MSYKMVRLDKLGKIITGNTPSNKKSEYYNEATTPFIKPNNFNPISISSLAEADEHLSLKGAAEGRLVEEGAVLVTCIGTIGSVGIASKQICFNQQINAVVPDEDVVNNRYLAYAIINRREQLRAIANAPVVPIINKKKFSAFEIPLPPLETQKKIVEVLDKAQALIDARKEQIRLMDELIQLVFYEMFGDPVTNPKGWEVKKLSEILETQPQNGMYKPKSEYVKNGFGVPILRIDALYNGKVENWDLKRINCSEKELEKYGLNVDDIIINRVNSIEYLGKCAHIDRLIEATVFESNMMRFSVVTSKINPFYLTRLLSHQYVYNQILICAKKTVNQASINQQDVKSFDIVVPDINLQNAFTLRAKEIEKRKNDLLESSNCMDENFKSIMNSAFLGELFKSGV